MTELNTDAIQQIVAPAVMIPACGLLLLSSTARMNTVLARTRAFHSERLSVWQLEAAPGSKTDAVRSLRLEGLEHQTHRLILRARLLRVTMLLLFAAISCNLLSVIGLGLRFVVEEPGWLYRGSVGVFIAGIMLMLGAMVTSIAEVKRIVETVAYEHDRVERLCGMPGESFPTDRTAAANSGAESGTEQGDLM